MLVKRRLEAGQREEAVIVAQKQSAGKGQYDRSFSSPEGGLYFSLLLRSELERQFLPLITLVTGVACAEYLKHSCRVSPQLKWPNDIMVNGRKLGGILCESIIYPDNKVYVIIGVGLNVNNSREDFPANLQKILTTVFDETKQCRCLEGMVENLASDIKNTVLKLTDDRQVLLEKWQAHDYLYGRDVLYIKDMRRITGVGKGIAPDGGYQITSRYGKRHHIIAGQVRAL